MILMRFNARARIPLGPFRFNITKRGLRSVSVKAGPLTLNPLRGTLSVDTPGPGSVQLTGDDARKIAHRMIRASDPAPAGAALLPGRWMKSANGPWIRYDGKGGWETSNTGPDAWTDEQLRAVGVRKDPLPRVRPQTFAELAGDPRVLPDGYVLGQPETPPAKLETPPWGTPDGQAPPVYASREPLPDLPRTDCYFDSGRAVARLYTADGSFRAVCADHDQPGLPPRVDPALAGTTGFRLGQWIGLRLGRLLYGRKP